MSLLDTDRELSRRSYYAATAPRIAAFAPLPAGEHVCDVAVVGDGITVNAIAPGPIPTEGASAAFAKGGAPDGAIENEMRRAVPLGRWGTPEDIGRMAVYLAGPAGSWITGAIMVVDGGASLARL